MDHIKTPIDVRPHWAQTDIVDADGTVLVSTGSGYEGEMIAGEFKRVVNEYDPLVAQRDALAAACVVSRQILAVCVAKYYDVILRDEEMDTMVRRVEQATRAALALVKGGDADQD